MSITSMSNPENTADQLFLMLSKTPTRGVCGRCQKAAPAGVADASCPHPPNSNPP